MSAYIPSTTEVREAWDRAVRWGTCDAGVTRDGEFQPCEKPAVALRIYDGDEHEPCVYPVCKHHTTHRLVTARVLHDALRGGAR